MYTLYLQPLGEVTIHLDTIRISGYFIYIIGYDDDHNPIEFIMDKLCYLEDCPYDYGYCHIVSYVKHGIKTFCDKYMSIG